MRLLIFAFIFLTGISAVIAQKSNDNDPTKQLYALFDSEWEYNLRENPTFASYLGDKRYNDKWSNQSLSAIENRHQHRIETLEKIKKLIGCNCPSPTNSIMICSEKIMETVDSKF